MVAMPNCELADEFRPRTVDMATGVNGKVWRTTNLVLDEELDTLNRGSSGLRDGSGDTAHC